MSDGVALPEELDYLLEESIQNEILDVWKETVVVNSKVVDESKVDITITASNNYTALHNSYMLVTCKVTKANGAACNHDHDTTPDKVGIVNNFAQSLWRNVKVKINGEEAEELGGLHAYRAYIENLFNHQAFSLTKRKALLGWAKDTAGKFNIDEVGGGNVGMDTRTAPFRNSAEVTLVSKPACDFMTEKIYLPPLTKVDIELDRHEDKFVLIAKAGSYEVHISSIRFVVERVRVRPEIDEAHQLLFKALPNNKLRFPARRISLKKFVVNAGVPNADVQLFSGTLPDRILVALLSKTASEGVMNDNPYDFKHFGVKKVFLKVNDKHLPRDDYEPDFSKKNGYLREYYGALEFFGAHAGNTTLDLTEEDYGAGFTFFPFCLVPRREHGALLGEQVTGVASLHLDFVDAPVDALQVLVFAETRSELVIDGALQERAVKP